MEEEAWAQHVDARMAAKLAALQQDDWAAPGSSSKAEAMAAKAAAAAAVKAAARPPPSHNAAVMVSLLQELAVPHEAGLQGGAFFGGAPLTAQRVKVGLVGVAAAVVAALVSVAVRMPWHDI